MREKYTLKLDSGHIVKIRKGEVYGFNVDALRLDFQEHPAAKYHGVHTHIWLEVVDDPDTTKDIYEYVLWHLERYPQKTTMQALVIAWELDEDEKEFEGPIVLYELIVNRKISKTLFAEIRFWALEIYDVVIGHVSIRSLFGESVEF